MKQEKDIISFELTDSKDSFNVYPSSRWALESLSRIMIHLACNFTIYNLLVSLKSNCLILFINLLMSAITRKMILKNKR